MVKSNERLSADKLGQILRIQRYIFSSSYMYRCRKKRKVRQIASFFMVKFKAELVAVHIVRHTIAADRKKVFMAAEYVNEGMRKLKIHSRIGISTRCCKLWNFILNTFQSAYFKFEIVFKSIQFLRTLILAHKINSIILNVDIIEISLGFTAGSLLSISIQRESSRIKRGKCNASSYSLFNERDQALRQKLPFIGKIQTYSRTSRSQGESVNFSYPDEN